MARITYDGDVARRVGGFDMPIENGRPTFDHAAAEARTPLGDELDAPAGNPLVAPIVVPTLPRPIDDQVGAEYTLAAWRGLSDIRFRVEAIDDDTLSLRIESTDATRALDADVQPAAPPAHSATADPSSSARRWRCPSRRYEPRCDSPRCHDTGSGR
ncbi:hypothetical protein [Salinisphaera shabanensis]|uniref:hypothetical protein n=1 Tax=Salinisphaera shabanensis TaxID=180542 RepID=UPI0033421A93